METHKRSASSNSNQHIPSRPTTPLRPSSRTSFRSSAAVYDSYNPFGPAIHPSSGYPSASGRGANIFASLEPAFAELADGMADLEANFMHIQLLHESVSRFNENFAALLYGMNMNAFCVDFPEAPLVPDSFKRHAATAAAAQDGYAGDRDDAGVSVAGIDPDVTIVSTATSFVDHPSAASERVAGARGGVGRGRARAGSRGSTGTASASGIGRGRAASSSASGRGNAVGRERASGIARGTSSTRGRGVR